MKQFTVALLSFFLTTLCEGQVSGNLNYMQRVKYADSNIDVSFPPGKNLMLSIKGMANVRTDSYVVIFSAIQTGKTAEEVNALMDTRINQSLELIRKKANTEAIVDLVSFVPVYEYEGQSKIFSKKTYNEVPVGFELKKNIHVKYTNPNDLHDIMSILTASEVYDLVRVDYFSNSLETIKKELMTKAVTMIQEKYKTCQTLLGRKLDTLEKLVTDGYKTVLPVEMYKSYQAYNSSTLNPKKTSIINPADKSTTLYYQPILDKEFDFVINPIILEPVIQVMYEINLNINLDKEKPVNTQKEFILVTPNGDLKNINVANTR